MGHGAILPDRAGRRHWLGSAPMPLLFGSEGVDGRPWEIDPQLRARCVRLVRELPRESPSHLAAAVATARQDGVPCGAVRRRTMSTTGLVRVSPVEGLPRSSDRRLRTSSCARTRRRSARPQFSARRARPAQPAILAFGDVMRGEGCAELPGLEASGPHRSPHRHRCPGPRQDPRSSHARDGSVRSLPPCRERVDVASVTTRRAGNEPDRIRVESGVLKNGAAEIDIVDLGFST